MWGRKIQRQLKKTFGWESVDAGIQGVLAEVKSLPTPESQNYFTQLINQYGEFLKIVDEAYEEAEKKVNVAHRNLEISSEELSELNLNLRKLNGEVKTMIDSLAEGFFVVDASGICTGLVSKKAQEYLETDPKGRHLADILRVPKKEHPTFQDWLKFLFTERLPFEDMCQLGPQRLTHSNGQMQIQMGYKAIRNDEGKVSGLVVITTDITSEVEAHRRAEEMKSLSEMIVKFHNNKENFLTVLDMVQQLAYQCETWTGKDSNLNLFTILRKLHTLKAATATFSLFEFKEFIHNVETKLNQCRGESVSVTPELLKLIQTSGAELKNLLQTFLKKHEAVFGTSNLSSIRKIVEVTGLLKLGKAIQNHPASEKLLQVLIDEVTAVPVETLFAPIESNAYLLSQKIGRELKVTMTNTKNVRVVAELYREFFTELNHVFNNCIEHGIEPIEERIRLGKPRMGTIEVNVALETYKKGDLLKIVVEDDGRGVQVAKVREKLKASGGLLKNETDEQLVYRIFDFGLSTKDSVSDLSGRGVGMSALKNSVDQMGGKIVVQTREGKGTRFEFVLPWFSDFALIESILLDDLSRAHPGEKSSPLIRAS